MILSLIVFSCCYTAVANALLVPNTSSSRIESGRVKNVHHIFNAIHSSMRQWGSSRNHNGMSFFLATVPQGTQFYHGTGTPIPVKVMEWLAFEPEHAMLFAFAFDYTPRPPKKSPKDAGSDDDSEAVPGLQSAKWLQAHPLPNILNRHLAQQLLAKGDPRSRPRPPSNIRPGWLHTYQAKKDLNLLYIDGMAAAKSSKGTLDSQDYLLLKDEPPRDIFEDRGRALKLCSLARDRWPGRINGFIRMEHGFEIIMCSFAESLDVVRVTRARHWDEDDEDFGGTKQDAFSFYQAITARYHSIGGNRATLNYDHFVSAFAYHGLDLFESPEAMPRLRNVSKASLGPVMTDIDRMVLEADPPGPLDLSSRWQSIADEIVTRYVNRLQTLASGKLSNLTDFKLEIGRLFRPFIDFDDRDEAAEVKRCSLQFIPPAPSIDSHGASYGRRIVLLVSEDICTTLYSTTKMHNIKAAINSVEALIKRLNWTVWQECPTCASDEICITPIWPHGSVEDYNNPRCMNSTGFFDRHGYWDDMP